MKKLTLVSFRCRGKTVRAFLMLPLVDGRPVISQNKIDVLFYSQFGFTPTIGETISIGV
jgi:hypothetical protein